jgi:organic anion transporter 4A
MAAFLPKYLEYQFGLTSGQAAMLVGAIIVPAGAGGTLLGGYLVNNFVNVADSALIDE